MKIHNSIEIFKRDPRGWHASGIEVADRLAKEYGLDRDEVSREEYAEKTVREVADHIIARIGEQ